MQILIMANNSLRLRVVKYPILAAVDRGYI